MNVECFDLRCSGNLMNCECAVSVNSCEAGSGHVAAQVKGPTTQPPVMVTESDGLTALSFVPLETGEHMFFVTFDGINIPGN